MISYTHGEQRAPLEVFCSFAPTDEALWRQLAQRLTPWQRAGRLMLRHRGIVPLGANAETTLQIWQDHADMILLLVSPAFLADDTCYDEAQRAMQSSAQVIPVLLSPCHWKDTVFGGLQCLPQNGRAITLWPNQDQAWHEVTEGIHKALPMDAKLITRESNQHATWTRVTGGIRRILEKQSSRSSEQMTFLPRRALLLRGGLVSLLIVGGGAILWELFSAHQHTSASAVPSFQAPLYSCRGHTDVVETVAWSPDGTRIASGSWDKSVRIWDATSGNQLVLCQKHTDQVFGVAWSPDSQRIVSGSKDNKVYIWDAILGGDPLITYQGHAGQVLAVAWSPDGKRIASGGKEATVHVWDAKSGQHLMTYLGHTDTIRHLSWSSESRYLASGSEDTTVRVWDTEQGVGIYTYTEHTWWVVGLDWEPNGQRIASGSRDNSVHIWDAFGGTNTQVYSRHTKEVEAVAWRPGETDPNIASGSEDRTVQIWHVRGEITFQTISTLYDVESVAWAPDGTRLAVGTTDKNIDLNETTNLQVWPVHGKREKE